MNREIRHFSTSTPWLALCGYRNSLDSGQALTSLAHTVTCQACLRLRAAEEAAWTPAQAALHSVWRQAAEKGRATRHGKETA